LLPTAAAIFPYLQQIDASRIYSNFGPLSLAFTARCEATLNLANGTLLPTSSATSALMAALLAFEPDRSVRDLVVVPSFSFVASAAAVERCGLSPLLVDVDADTWMLSPQRVLESRNLDRVAAVMPVAPFGRPVCQEEWMMFRERTGLPVVIDGAASFSTVLESPVSFVGEIPVCFSFHATKGFGIGEGGCLVSTDRALIERATGIINFGFNGSRESRTASFNGKISEYHAAVGLAMLDDWPNRRAITLSVAEIYRQTFSALGLEAGLQTFPMVDASYVVLLCDSAHACRSIQTACDEAGIGWRMWYSGGIANQPWFADARKEDLSVTDDIALRLINLPMFPDISTAQIERIARTVSEACGK
jgi:dTDP-4-amino-4,6-dideoxygalactose transaminase